MRSSHSPACRWHAQICFCKRCRSTRTSRVTVPLGLGATFAVARQWDVQAAVAYDGIGYEDGYRAFGGSVAFAHFW